MPRVVRSFHLLVALLSISGCIGSSFPKCPGRGGPAWYELTSDHFVMDTNLEPAQAERALAEIEQRRSVMIAAMFDRMGDPREGLVRVLDLRSDELAHFLGAHVGQFHSYEVSEPVLLTSP